MTNDILNHRDQIKALLVKTQGSLAQKLLAIIDAFGFTDTDEITEMLGISDRYVRILRNKSSGTGVPAEQEFRNKSSENGTGVPPLARVEDNNIISFPTISEVKENKSLLRADAPKPKKEAHGTRLDPSWTLSEDLRQWTRASFPQTTDKRVADELATFHDYWKSAPGQKGRKADWEATWRNWCRKAFSTAPIRPHSQPPPSSDRNEIARRMMAMLNTEARAQ